jgi:hypothetical protein
VIKNNKIFEQNYCFKMLLPLDADSSYYGKCYHEVNRFSRNAIMRFVSYRCSTEACQARKWSPQEFKCDAEVTTQRFRHSGTWFPTYDSVQQGSLVWGVMGAKEVLERSTPEMMGAHYARRKPEVIHFWSPSMGWRYVLIEGALSVWSNSSRKNLLHLGEMRPEHLGFRIGDPSTCSTSLAFR